jgi:Family of unknown function (DUF6515)
LGENMVLNHFKKNIRTVSGTIFIGILSISTAFAWSGGRDHYRYHDGRFYRPGFLGFEVAVAVPPIGAIVTAVPDGYTTVIVGGLPYYYYGGVYFRPYQYGYIVVQAPNEYAAAPVPQSNTITQAQPTAPPQEAEQPKDEAQPAKSLSGIPDQNQINTGDTVTINVPQSKGGYVPVKLVKHHKGYVGPQGEFYPSHPTIQQLKALYGD